MDSNSPNPAQTWTYSKDKSKNIRIWKWIKSEKLMNSNRSILSGNKKLRKFSMRSNKMTFILRKRSTKEICNLMKCIKWLLSSKRKLTLYRSSFNTKPERSKQLWFMLNSILALKPCLLSVSAVVRASSCQTKLNHWSHHRNYKGWIHLISLLSQQLINRLEPLSHHQRKLMTLKMNFKESTKERERNVMSFKWITLN